LISCDALAPTLQALKTEGYAIATLEARAPQSLFSYQAPARTVFVLGGETEGVSAAASQLTDQRLAIPMNNEVESLNVAVTAALVAFHLTAHSD
jgi:23S rRNA (guanosine2251-2'-O)-methyltransferase